MDTIICAMISAVAAIIVGVINSGVQQQRLLARLDKHSALQHQRIEQLEVKMDKHNQLIERTYELEKRSAVQEREMKATGKRLDDLEAFCSTELSR